MKKCPKCSETSLTAEDQFCRSCGADLTVEKPPASESSNEEADLDFIVTETECSSPEFIGSESEKSGIPDESPSLAEDGIPTSTDSSWQPYDSHPIGSSTPPPPPAVDEKSGPAVSVNQPSFRTQLAPKGGRAFPGSTVDLPAPSARLVKEEEAQTLRQRLEAAQSPGRSAPKEPARSDTPDTMERRWDEPEATPEGPPVHQMANRSRGVAFYYKNLVQLAGQAPLKCEDTLTVNDREYELRPKQLDNRIVIGAASAVLAIVIIFAASIFVGDSDSGHGQLIGVVLDQWDQPYVGKSEVHLSDLGTAVSPNAQGFFLCENIPTGAHEVQYWVDGELIGEEFATVVSGKLTMLFLRPSQTEAGLEPETTSAASDPTASVTGQPTQSGSSQTSRTSKTKNSSSQNRWAKLTLAANIENARLVVDGETLGAGNLTYAKLLPGKHRYEVSRDGYQSTSGTFELKGGQTSTLSVVLEPAAEQKSAPTSQDHYFSGLTLADKGDFDGAVTQYDEAIRLDPGNVDAYQARAATLSRLRRQDEAHDDYIRVAEIYRSQGNSGRAITAYNAATEMNAQSMTAYLGRGDLYLSKNQEIAALADFETAREIDNKDYRVHFGLGRARFQQGNFNRAVEHFKDAQSANDASPLVYQYLMLSYMAVDDVKKVRKSWERFAAIASANEMQQIQSDERFASVLEVVNNN